MASRVLAIFLVQAVVFQAIFAQNINRIIPLEALLSNPLLLNQLAPSIVPIAPSVVPVAPSVVACEQPIVETVVSTPVAVPTTTIIQDSTVANNLANALQLLIVSNLLSNTLPAKPDVVIPACASPVDLISPVVGGINYVY
ncbi:uncharacterized protein LOC131855395 [Achroia grisella]|uniref:uncharacterized protein LOC131855395 n=1 Tax=Achroia grisella TaxID=688607 RepID=UPI0027D26BC6|nr:uncharacterized protein LOC131855395 [Achroia grisella]